MLHLERQGKRLENRRLQQALRHRQQGTEQQGWYSTLIQARRRVQVDWRQEARRLGADFSQRQDSALVRVPDSAEAGWGDQEGKPEESGL